MGFVRGTAWALAATVLGAAAAGGENTVRMALYGRAELTFGDGAVRRGRALNPFDPAQVRLDAHIRRPDGTTVVLPGYFGQPCARNRRAGAVALKAVKDERFGWIRGDEEDPGAPKDDDAPAKETEWWSPRGDPDWRVRFSPARAGVYTYEARVTRGAEPAEVVGTGTMVVGPAEPGDRGMLRRHPARANRFQYDNGDAAFLLGYNVGWTTWARVVGGFEDDFARMAESGQNFARVWTCTWSLGLETEKPYAYHLGRAAQLDAVLDAAGKHGIAVMLCLDNYHDFQYNWPDQNPYARKNGGPCSRRAEFFTNPAARAQYAARLRYMAARYGAYRSLMAWELWNEQNYALTDSMLYAPPTAPAGHFGYEDGPMPGSPEADALPYSTPAPSRARDAFHLPWIRWAVGELRALDAAHGHMTTTSLGQFGHWPDLWRMPEMDIVQLHAYVNRSEYARTALEEDGAAFVAAAQTPLDAYGKPAFLSEFGYMGDGAASALAARDPEGVLLHNSLWAGLMGGAAGSPMWWWWDNYIAPNGLDRHYRGLARFVDGVDWNDAFVPRRVENDVLRVWTLTSPTRVFVWLQARDATWARRVRDGRTPASLRNVRLALRGLSPGAWRVEWVDTLTGDVRATAPGHAGADGRLTVTAPPFTADIAARAVRAGTGK